MNEWIECNLPWDTENSKEHEDAIWNNKEIKALENVLTEKAEKYLGDKFEDMNKLVEDINDWDLMDKISKAMKKYMENHNCSKLEAYQAYDGKVLFKNKLSTNIIKYRLFHLRHEEWLKNQEEHHLIEKMLENLRDQADKYNLEYNKSFCRMGLNKPGTLIEYFNNEGVLVQELIGHMNTSSGVCDDCRAFSDKQIIKRYKIVWDGEK